MTATEAPAAAAAKAKPRRSHWAHRPPLPIGVSPVFRWPPDPVAIVRWFWRSWFPASEKLIILGFAAASWALLPPPERAAEIGAGWIAWIWLRNLGLMTLVAGGLHLWLYTFRRQGDDLRYDSRDLIASHRAFTFGSQVGDNMFWTLASGVTVWTAYEALMIWALANGYAPLLAWDDNPVWFVLLFFLLPVWETVWFYWIHRLLHWPPLYRVAHAVHHRNSNVGPWSGLSMHPIEHVLYLGSVMIHWVVAAHPVHILFHLQYFTLSAATTHAGFAGLSAGGRNRLPLGTFHHQLHHRYFECNYGGLEIPWDKWFGTFHDGTPESHARMRARLARLRQPG